MTPLDWNEVARDLNLLAWARRQGRQGLHTRAAPVRIEEARARAIGRDLLDLPGWAALDYSGGPDLRTRRHCAILALTEQHYFDACVSEIEPVVDIPIVGRSATSRTRRYLVDLDYRIEVCRRWRWSRNRLIRQMAEEAIKRIADAEDRAFTEAIAVDGEALAALGDLPDDGPR